MDKGEVSWRAVRLESLALLCPILAAYWRSDASWYLFAALFLAPDITALGYLAGRGAGAAAYNLSHSLIGPIALVMPGFLFAFPLVITLALIWTAHIVFDRAIGYGFKQSTATRVDRRHPTGILMSPLAGANSSLTRPR